MNEKKNYPVISFDNLPAPQLDQMAAQIQVPRSRGPLSNIFIKREIKEQTEINSLVEKRLRSQKGVYDAAHDLKISIYKYQNVEQEIDDIDRDAQIKRTEKDAEHEVKLSGLAMQLLENRNKIQELNKKRVQTEEDKQKERLEKIKRDAEFERAKQSQKIDNAILSIADVFDAERQLKLRYQDVEEGKALSLIEKFLDKED